MSAPVHPRLALLGMPRTGKSTYLGAFWALVEAPVETAVRETNFSGDRSYVQKLAEQVARGEEIDRTAVDADESLAVTLAFDPHGEAELVIPDTSGESLRLLVERRVWHPRLIAACREASAFLLFVHPEHLRMPTPLSLLGAVAAGEDQHTEAVPDLVAFDAPRDACTAAELIDVIENLTERVHGRWPIRIAVVVSAWDLVDGPGTPTPVEWLRTRLPGVLATLECNPEIVDFEIFGVSAQGGPLAAREELLARGEIADRVRAQRRSGEPASLIEPVRWAIWGS
jgi:Double-GTPase 1